MHWSKRSQWNREFKRQVYWAAKVAKVPHYKKAIIEIIYYCFQPMDFDNAYTSAKPLLDGLVDAMVIPDDSPDFISLRVHCVKIKHRPEQRTEIIIKEKT